MNIIRTTIKISKTIRNVGRLREIVSIFARHGFSEFISLSVIAKIPGMVLPKPKVKITDELNKEKDKDWSQVIGFRLRTCFEELGPAFIKLGQLLSSREDLFAPSFIDEMKVLRDKVKGIDFEDAKKTIETSLEDKIENIFSELDEIPIGTASIGVVYKGKLLSGEEVVVKVRRPNIVKEIETDFSIMLFLAGQAEKMSRDIRYLGVGRILKDFSLSLQNEVNFNIEALNGERLAKVIQKHDSEELFHLPKIYRDLTREDVLVMERIQGIPFSNEEKIVPVRDEIVPKIENGVRIFLKTFLQEGFFHADLHGGNFFYLNDKKIGLIDFGLIGSLGKRSRQNFLAIVYSLLTYNYENLVYEFLDVADYEDIPDIDDLIGDVRDSLSPFIGLTVSQTNFSQVLKAIVETLNKHQIFLPREWFVVFRAFITLDGVGKDLDLDLDLFTIMEEDIADILKESFNKQELVEEAVWGGRDLVSTTRLIPRHIKWFLKDLARKKYAFEILHTGHKEDFDKVTKAIVFTGLAILSGAFIFAGIEVAKLEDIYLVYNIPIISWLLWGISFLCCLRGLFIIRKI